MSNLFNQELQVVNIGLQSFKDTLDKSGVKAVQLAWKPPLSVSAAAMQAMTLKKDQIERANQEAVQKSFPANLCWSGWAKPSI